MLLYEEMRHSGRNRQSYCFIILVSIQQRLQSESSGAGINQKVSILLAVAAGANKMIVHINNRPNSWASQRTRARAGGKRPDIELDGNFELNESHLQLRFIGQRQRSSGSSTSDKIKLQLVFVTSKCILNSAKVIQVPQVLKKKIIKKELCWERHLLPFVTI